MAARATVSQALQSCCSAMYKEQAEDASESEFDKIFEEVTKLLAFCTEKLLLIAR